MACSTHSGCDAPLRVLAVVCLGAAGVLSWKLSGEDVLRASGLRYTVVRPTGLTDKDIEEKFILEV